MPAPRVDHLERHPAVGMRGPDGERAAALRRHRVHGVGHEVEAHLLKLARVAEDGRKVVESSCCTRTDASAN